MKIEGAFTVAAPRTYVWRHIIDPEVMGPCIPGCDSIEVTGPNTYLANVQVKLGPIKTKFNLEVEVIEEVEPDHIISRTRGEEGSRASMVSAENVLRLSDADSGGTQVYYSSEVAIVGRLGKYGHGVMKKVAKKLCDKFADNFRERVENSKAA
ncbi:MAG: carbon monoxide dehydrogenase subunit G [Alphaproteobacteria bacterium]|nr:carbon monoxide dehydrogenase subunit G [Alphaproteobacteria bacterium]